MKPFKINKIPSEAFIRYLSSYNFFSYLEKLEEHEIEGFLRQHVTEGIPFVFKNFPLVYEEVRTYLSKKIGIHPKEIILIGSASIGFSMSHLPDFGKKFNKKSDLDFTIISNSLFDNLSRDFETWKNEVDDGTTKPKNKNQVKYWDENLKKLPRNIKKGFIDTYLIPNLYPNSSKVNNALWEVSEKLKATIKEYFSIERKFSARVYSDWKSFSRQFMLNYHYAVDKITKNDKNLLKLR